MFQLNNLTYLLSILKSDNYIKPIFSAIFSLCGPTCSKWPATVIFKWSGAHAITATDSPGKASMMTTSLVIIGSGTTWWWDLATAVGNGCENGHLATAAATPNLKRPLARLRGNEHHPGTQPPLKHPSIQPAGQPITQPPIVFL